MTLWLAIPLAIYAAGVLWFLCTERERVLGGWVQFVFTAAIWPVLVTFILIEYRRRE